MTECSTLQNSANLFGDNEFQSSLGFSISVSYSIADLFIPFRFIQILSIPAH